MNINQLMRWKTFTQKVKHEYIKTQKTVFEMLVVKVEEDEREVEEDDEEQDEDEEE